MTKISELSAGSTSDGTEKIPAVQSGITVRLTARQVANAAIQSGSTSGGTLYNNSSAVSVSTVLLIQTSGGYEFVGVGDDVASAVSRATGTKPVPLVLSRLVNWSSINDATAVDYSTLTAQDSVSNQYASFASVIRTTSTAFDWSHLAAFEDLKTYAGSGTLTSDYSFLSAPTISGATTSRYAVKVNDPGGVGSITANYGLYVASLTRGTSNWGVYSIPANYFGGNVLIGTAGTAPTTPALTINKNAASPLAPAAATNLLQLTNVDGTGTNIELNAYGTSAVGSLGIRAARGTKASPTAIQSGDTITSWYGSGYGTSAFDDFTGVIELVALENFTNTANGSAWNFYTNTTGATSITKRLQIAAGLVVGSSGSDPGAGSVNATTSIVSPVHSSAAAIQFQTNGTTFAGNVTTGQQWVLGQNVTPGSGVVLTGTNNSTAPVAPTVPSTAHFIGADATSNYITLDAVGTAKNPGLATRSGRGTYASKTATQSGDNLFSFNNWGYDGTNNWTSATGEAVLASTAAENWTGSAKGTYWQFYTTATGGTTLAEKMRLGSGLMLNTFSSDPGAGHIIQTGGATMYSGTAVPAGGTTGAGLKMSSTSNLGIFFGSGVPTLSAAQGSIYIRTDGSSTSTRLYINTNGSTTWTNVTTAA